MVDGVDRILKYVDEQHEGAQPAKYALQIAKRLHQRVECTHHIAGALEHRTGADEDEQPSGLAVLRDTEVLVPSHQQYGRNLDRRHVDRNDETAVDGRALGRRLRTRKARVRRQCDLDVERDLVVSGDRRERLGGDRRRQQECERQRRRIRHRRHPRFRITVTYDRRRDLDLHVVRKHAERSGDVAYDVAGDRTDDGSRELALSNCALLRESFATSLTLGNAGMTPGQDVDSKWLAGREGLGVRDDSSEVENL